MFTGIVEELGHIHSLRDGRLRIDATHVVEGAEIGESIAVNGCCLTVVAFGDDWWEADVSPETISRSAKRTAPSAQGSTRSIHARTASSLSSSSKTSLRVWPAV